MPHIAPPDGETGWPVTEGTLGVVGVAPWATLDFLRVFYEGVAATKDWHYPRVIVDVNTKLPSRGRHLQLGETDPSPAIRDTIDELAAAGATTVVVACNTAHILWPRWGPDHECQVISIIETAVTAVRQLSPVGSVMVLASRSLTEHGTYTEALDEAGLSVYALGPEEVSAVSRAIESVKTSGGLDAEAEQALADLALGAAGQGATAAIIGCTELSSATPVLEQAGLSVVDSNSELAKAALSSCGFT